MKETRRKITLPSGGTMVIRKVTVYDTMPLGFIPQAFPESIARRKAVAEGKDASPLSVAELKQGAEWARIALLTACSPITVEGKRRKIVDKELDAVADNEITIGELSDEDATFILNEINSLSGLAKEAASKISPFPAEQKSNGDTAPSGEGIREAPE